MATYGPGDKAPDFELPIRSKEAVTLSAALQDGPVVLLTYLFDFSPGWTNELSEFGNRIGEFTALGVQVFGISVDSIWAHQAWQIVSGFPDELALLSDFNRDFGEAYGLTYTTSSGSRGVLRRTVFVIDRDGTITYRWDVPDPPALPQVDEVLAALRGLKPRTRPTA